MKLWTGEAVLKMAGHLADNHYEQYDAEDAVRAIEEQAGVQVEEADVKRWLNMPRSSSRRG